MTDETKAAIDDTIETLKQLGLQQAITVQAGLALQDAVAAARDHTTMRQVMFSQMLEEARELPLKDRLEFIKELYSSHSDLTDRMEKIFDKVDSLKAANK